MNEGIEKGKVKMVELSPPPPPYAAPHSQEPSHVSPVAHAISPFHNSQTPEKNLAYGLQAFADDSQCQTPMPTGDSQYTLLDQDWANLSSPPQYSGSYDVSLENDLGELPSKRLSNE